MKHLLSRQAIQYIYQDYVDECLKKGLPAQQQLSETQLEKIFGVIKSAANAVFGKKLYPTIYHQVAFIMYQLNKQHILTDGNKRFSLLLALYILEMHKIHHSEMSMEDWEMFVMRIAADNKYSLEKAVVYLKKKLS